MKVSLLTGAFIAALLVAPPVSAESDAARGARAFRACAACHSTEADRNMTGPSLADVLNRKAGGLASFPRYSEAMKNSGVTWDEKSLDAYLKDPAHFMPGNHMTFAGVPDERVRGDIIAFLKGGIASGSAQSAQTPPAAMPGMGMGGQRAVPNLKAADPSSRIKTITYCRETFKVTTLDGTTRDFWERNLRFKTVASEEGPEKGKPAILNAGMMGDRASVVFAAPEEISTFIVRRC